MLRISRTKKSIEKEEAETKVVQDNKLQDGKPPRGANPLEIYGNPNFWVFLYYNYSNRNNIYILDISLYNKKIFNYSYKFIFILIISIFNYFSVK